MIVTLQPVGGHSVTGLFHNYALPLNSGRASKLEYSTESFVNELVDSLLKRYQPS